MITLAPCSESSSAVARPMPRAEPVTIATLSSRTPMAEEDIGGPRISRGPPSYYGVVVLRANVSVFEYAPVRSGAVAPMCWRNVIAETALDTGSNHVPGAMSTCSASGSEKAPLVRRPGSDTVSAASPALEITLAVVDAVYVRSVPATNVPKEGVAPSVSESVAGTDALTAPVVFVYAVTPR